MDITRNWRLKMSRSQLLATRCPETGAVLLPQRAGANPTGAFRIYRFDVEAAFTAVGEAEYAQAAR